MTKHYDKIIKENLEEIFLPLTKKLLNLEFDLAVEIADDLQITLETVPDFLKRISNQNPLTEFILHIEFQSAADRNMAERMLLYYSMLYKKYGIPIYQQVFYLGKGNSAMITEIQHENINFRYNVLDFNAIPYTEFLSSEKPEELILAILGNFLEKPAEEIAELILHSINSLKIRNEIKLKAVKQLEVLSGLRNLQTIIVELIPKIMALDYDIRKDLRYQQGLEQGEKIGEKIGEKKGLKEKQDKVIIALIKKGKLSRIEIAEVTEVTSDYVNDLAKTIGL